MTYTLDLLIGGAALAGSAAAYLIPGKYPAKKDCAKKNRLAALIVEYNLLTHKMDTMLEWIAANPSTRELANAKRRAKTEEYLTQLDLFEVLILEHAEAADLKVSKDMVYKIDGEDEAVDEEVSETQ